MKNNNQSFIKIYNSFLENGDNKLSPKQLYFYALLHARYSPFLECTETTLSILNESQIVYKDKNERKNIANIKKTIFSLHDMGFIKIECSDSKIDKNSFIRVKFPTLADGFEQVKRDIFNMAENENELYILITIQRFKNGYEKAKSKWADVLGCSKNTGIAIINKMLEDKKIYCVEGVTYKDNQGRFKQDPTKWYLCEKPVILLDSEEKEKLVEQMEETKQEVIENKIDSTSTFDTIYGELTLDDIMNRYSESNWGKKIEKNGKQVNAPIEFFEYAVYKIMKDNGLQPGVVKKCESIINLYKKKDFYDGTFEQLEAEYQSQLKKKKREEMLKQSNNVVIDTDGNYIPVNVDNIDTIDFSKVEKIVYDNCGKVETKFASFYRIMRFENGDFVYEQAKEGAFEYAVELYKEHVKTNEVLDFEKCKKIQTAVFDKFYEPKNTTGERVIYIKSPSTPKTEQKNEQVKQLSFKNISHDDDEPEYKPQKKKDDRDISKFLDDEEEYWGTKKKDGWIDIENL